MTDFLEPLARDLLVLALGAVIVPAILLVLASPFALLFWVTELAIRTHYRREWRRREREVRGLRHRATRDPSVLGVLEQHLEELLTYYEAVDDELALWEVSDPALRTELIHREYAVRSKLAALRGTRPGKRRLDPSATPRQASRSRGGQRASAQGVFRPFGRGTVHS